MKYPKATKLFIEWFSNNEEFCEHDIEKCHHDFDCETLETDLLFDFNNSFFKKYIFFNRGSLLEFFDQQDILIDTITLEKNKFFCTVTYKQNYYTKEYNKRFDSLTEAFDIAFELLERKLN